MEDGDSCYCGDNADRIIPALPHECAMPCSGNDLDVCGSAYRMNAYGPIFRSIRPDEVILDYQTVFHSFEVHIDLKLEDNTSDEKQNIFSFTVKGASYPNIDSQIPAAFLTPNNELEICMQINGATDCRLTKIITPGQWLNLWIEQYCWSNDENSICTVYALIDGVVEYFWINDTPMTFRNVQSIVGDTYDGQFEAAAGYFKKLALYSHESRDAPSEQLGAVVDFAAVDLANAINA